jgi:hypothetical protein
MLKYEVKLLMIRIVKIYSTVYSRSVNKLLIIIKSWQKSLNCIINIVCAIKLKNILCTQIYPEKK